VYKRQFQYSGEIEPKSVALHWTVGKERDPSPFWNLWIKNKVSCNYLVSIEGKIFDMNTYTSGKPSSPTKIMKSHCTNWANAHTISIEISGGPDASTQLKTSEVTRKRAKELVKALICYYNIDPQSEHAVVGHYEVDKSNPSDVWDFSGVKVTGRRGNRWGKTDPGTAFMAEVREEIKNLDCNAGSGESDKIPEGNYVTPIKSFTTLRSAELTPSKEILISAVRPIRKKSTVSPEVLAPL